MILRKRVRNEEGGKGGRKQRREEVVLIRSPKTFPLDDRLFSTRRDAGEARKLGSIFASVAIVENRGWKKRAFGVVSPSRDAAFAIPERYWRR